MQLSPTSVIETDYFHMDYTSLFFFFLELSPS